MNSIYWINVYERPFVKEELNLSFEFEDNDSLEIQYAFVNVQSLNKEFNKFYYEEVKKNFKNHFKIPTYEEIELKYKIKKGLVSKVKLATNNWDLEEGDSSYKCRVDEENEVNVFYIKSFPQYLLGMSNLDECFQNFYQNSYPIIVIEDYNTGGKLKFANALIKYVQPRISKPFVTSGKPLTL